MPAPNALCAQYGNVQSYYGHIQCGRFLLTPYVWGAWELPYPEHYPSGLTEQEEKTIKEQRDNESVALFTPTAVIENSEAIILRLRHETRLQAIKEYRPPLRKANREAPNYDDEDFFILM